MIKYKFFTIGQYEQKQKWINDMCSKGYALKSCNMYKYDFEPCIPNQYYYAFELLENLSTSPTREDFLNYLCSEWHVEYVCQYRNWVFFRRSKSEGKFSLFNNMSRKIYYFKRILIFRFTIVFLLSVFAYFNFLYPCEGYSDYIFSFLLIIICTLIIITTFPSFIKYIKLKKSNKNF